MNLLESQTHLNYLYAYLHWISVRIMMKWIEPVITWVFSGFSEYITSHLEKISVGFMDNLYSYRWVHVED